MFALMISVARSHSMFPKEHFSWLDKFQKEMPKESQDDVRRRKDGRYLSADVLIGIPSKIPEDRLSLEQTDTVADHAGPYYTGIDFRRARLAMFELIMRIIARLFWPPRLIYLCRVDGQNPNIFFERIDPRSDIQIDDWFKDQHARDQDAKCWQYRFDPSETGSRIKRGMWPFSLIQLLEEFKEFRKVLVRDKATDTLFANCWGGPILGHGGFVLAEKLFGRHLNPSDATPAVENWHSERQQKSSIKSGALRSMPEGSLSPATEDGAEGAVAGIDA